MDKSAAMIGHFDVAGSDMPALARFYSEVFGWEVTSRGPGYSQVTTPNLAGALVEAPESSLTLGVIVSNLQKVLEHAEAEGGAIAMAAIDNGWVRKAQIRDPAGNVLTLIQK